MRCRVVSRVVRVYVRICVWILCGDRPTTLERYREEQSGLCVVMTCSVCNGFMLACVVFEQLVAGALSSAFVRLEGCMQMCAYESFYTSALVSACIGARTH